MEWCGDCGALRLREGDREPTWLNPISDATKLYHSVSSKSEGASIIRHFAYIEADLESFHRGSSTRTATCFCGWRGPQRATLIMVADDALGHEHAEEKAR